MRRAKPKFLLLFRCIFRFFPHTRYNRARQGPYRKSNRPPFPLPPPLFTVYANVLPSAAHVCPVCRFAVRAPSGRHCAGRFLAPSAAFPACTSAVSFSRRPQDGKYKYLFRRNSPAGRHGLAGNLLFLHRFERLRRAGQHRFRAEGTRDRIQLKTFR